MSPSPPIGSNRSGSKSLNHPFPFSRLSSLFPFTRLEAPIGEGHRSVLGRGLVGLGVLLDQAPLDGLDARDEQRGLNYVADGEGEDEEVRVLCFYLCMCGNGLDWLVSNSKL